MQRLSTGVKINSAKDDAAGLAISNRMTSQIRGFAKAIQNTNDAISMTQTANAGLTNVQDVLQRMRELAVQSSTGTLNASDRASIQTEVSQLKSQIDTIASATNHNNIKLLDGSAQNVQIQTGVNAGQQISIGFDSMQTKDIGIGSKAVVTSAGGTLNGTAFGALSASALYLNGVAVGQSQAVDDNSSPRTDAAASAIAKAAAINRVATLSGVYAKADSTVVAGSAMVAGTGGTATTVTINGVTTDSFANAADNSLTRKSVVAAINAKSAITGVVANDTGDDNLGVTLTAADGRNIVLSSTGATASSLGLKASASTTYVGSYDLFTYDGRSINVSTSTISNSAVAASGLVTGSYKSDLATTASYARSVETAGVAPTSSDVGLLNSNSIVINGVQIGQALTTDDTASDVSATSSSRAASAIAIAAAINRSSGQTGVTATAQANNVVGSSFNAVTAAMTSTAVMYINGTNISLNSMTRDGVINSVNNVAGQTGVVASANGDGITYTAADGRNISIALGLNVTVSNVGLGGQTIAASASGTPTFTGAVTFYSTVQLSSSNQFTIKSGSNGVTNLELLGFRQGSFGGVDNGQKINQVDVSTSSGASTAIATIDAAINTVNGSLAKVGAFNNRLDSIISNLSSMNQNITASRGRIIDTDYSTETTNLAKQQIIQQASTAMLAQANQSSQNVLSLLK